MINETDWIILPVGNNLGDHLNVSRILRANLQTTLTYIRLTQLLHIPIYQHHIMTGRDPGLHLSQRIRLVT